ncbi:SIR2 family protein [Flavobacterium faecale]|uniref:SIR2 family protein n=1 Tax=Flavobacterium faecale TaxID=1355330 RepID=UPI001B86E56A|nr:SIR2 family protein [Flavobacterium faecale]
MEQVLRILQRNPEIEPFENILFITSTPISPRFREMFEKRMLDQNIHFKVVLWGSEEINKIVSKNKKEANDIANNLFSLRIESAVVQVSKDWEKERTEKIEILKLLYKKGQFSFFLGAGVSSSAGMPDWNTLLNSLFVTYLTNEFDNETKILDTDINQIVERLNEMDEPSALMAARYLRKGLDNSVSESEIFNKTITENLYKLRDVSKKIDSDLILSITEMCMPLRTGAKIKSVITYNFDDLIERQLEKQSIRHHSIYTDNEFIDPDELLIYHVHGFLPEDVKAYESLDKSTLVFSEEGYHLMYSDSYHWSNLVQLSNLRDNNCLMVGLSMTDPNLRRLLDISSRNSDKTRHFAFMKRLTIDSFTSKEGKKVIDNIDGAKKFLDRHHNLNEEIMRELGVSIIWYTGYDEIPKLLTEIIK